MIKGFWYSKQFTLTLQGKILTSSSHYIVECCLRWPGKHWTLDFIYCKWSIVLRYVVVTFTAHRTIQKEATRCKKQGRVRCSGGPSTQGRLRSPTFENISYFSMLWTSGNWRNRGEIFPTQEHFLWVNLRSTNSMAGSTRLYSPGRPSVHFYWTCLGPLRHEVHYPGRFKLRGAFGLDKVHR